MPIIRVQQVTDTPPLPGVSQQLAASLGSLLNAPKGQCWVMFSTLPRHQYAENGVAFDETPSPVFIEIQFRQLPSVPERRVLASSLAEAAASVLKIASTQVHILFAPPGLEHIAFGGHLIEQCHVCGTRLTTRHRANRPEKLSRYRVEGSICLKIVR